MEHPALYLLGWKKLIFAFLLNIICLRILLSNSEFMYCWMDKLIMISLRTHQPAWRAVQALQALLWCWRFMSSPKVEKTIWSRKMCLLEMILPKLRKFALCLRTWLECPILLTMDYTVLLMEKVRIIENCKKPPKITMLQKLSKCKVKA